MLIILERGEDAGTADVRFLEKPTGVEILMRLLAGDGAKNPDLVEAAEYGSFLSVRRGSMEVQGPFSGPDYWAPFIALGA